MEEAYNGKVEEETQLKEGNEENGESILKDVDATKPETQPGREIPVEGNWESLNESLEGNDPTPDGGIAPETEAAVKDSDEQETAPAAIPEVSIQDTKGLEADRVEADDLVSTFNNVVVEGSDEIASSVAASIDAVTGEMEEKTVQLFSEDKMIPPLDENVSTITEVASEASEEAKVSVTENSSAESEAKVSVTGNSSKESAIDVGKEESEEKVDESEKASTNNPAVVESSDAYPETPENSNAASPSSSIQQPTAWRKCCGLFEVLRRSNT